MSRRIVVIGGGITGAALAAALSEDNAVAVTVLERGPRERLLGSTGHVAAADALSQRVELVAGFSSPSPSVIESLPSPQASAASPLRQPHFVT